MKKLFRRALSGFIFVGVLIFCIYYSKISFIVLFYILMTLCLFEFKRMIQLKSYFPYIIGTLVFIFGNILNVEDVPSKALFEYIGVALFLTIFISFVSILFAKKNEVIDHLGKIFLTIIYIVVPFTLMVQIPFLNATDYVNSTILGVFILIWTNDTFAFLVGKNFGRNKLLERISPNKTIEGFVGGMIFTFIVSFVLSNQFNLSLTTVQWVVIAGIVSIFGVLGDLIESMFKRQAGVKDSSNLIPGHGGFLDRLDSAIFSAPFIFIYLQLIQ